MKPEGFVLAGGASRRMGSDKARLLRDGIPWAVQVALALGPHCSQVRIVRHEAEEPGWTWPDGTAIDVVVDAPGEGRHPLWGLVAAMRAAQTARVVVAPCDLEGLTGEHVSALLAAGPAVAEVDGRVQPLLGVFEASEAGRAEDVARAGGSVMGFVRGVGRVELSGIRNVNAPGSRS